MSGTSFFFNMMLMDKVNKENAAKVEAPVKTEPSSGDASWVLWVAAVILTFACPVLLVGWVLYGVYLGLKKSFK